MTPPRGARIALGLVLALAAPAGAAPSQDPPPLPGEGADPEVRSLLVALREKVLAEPANAEAHSELGLAFEANTYFADAAQCYRNVLTLTPDAKQWIYRLGVMQTAMGALEGALESMRGAAASFRNTPVIQARLGDLLLTVGEADAAAAAFEQAIASEEKQPQNIAWPASRVGLARARYDQGRVEEAAALLKEAISLDAGYRHAHYLLGLCYLDLGRQEEGEVELALGVNAWPRFPPDPHQPKLDGYSVGYHRRMMEIENLVAAEALEEAEARLRAVLEERPTDAPALSLLAKTLNAQGRAPEALDALGKSEAADPTSCSTKIELAVALMNRVPVLQSEYQNLHQQFQRAQGDPQVSEEKRAEMAAELQRRAAQLETFSAEIVTKAQEAVQIAPSLGRARYFLGLAYLQTAGEDPQRMQSAIAELERALVYGCQEPELYRTLGMVYAQSGRLDDMVEYAEAYARSRPDDPGTWVFLAQARMTRDQSEPDPALRAGAMQAVTRARGLSPNDPQLIELHKAFQAEVDRRNQAAGIDGQGPPLPADQGDGGGR